MKIRACVQEALMALRPTSAAAAPPTRKPWHGLLLFTPALELLLLTVTVETLPRPFRSKAETLLFYNPILLGLGCLMLGFWWRRHRKDDRFAYGMLAGLAVLCLNAGALCIGAIGYVFLRVMLKHAAWL